MGEGGTPGRGSDLAPMPVWLRVFLLINVVQDFAIGGERNSASLFDLGAGVDHLLCGHHLCARLHDVGGSAE